jgi:hypothetical protein
MLEIARPRQVGIGVAVYVAALVFGLFKIILVPVRDPWWIAPIIVVIMMGLAFAIWRRQNWARYLLLILFLLGLPMLFAIRAELAQQGVLGFAILVLQTIAQAISLVFFFSRPSSGWFRRNER